MNHPDAQSTVSAAEVRLGTQGWSYADWVGPFYPPGSKPADYLAFYTRVFDTVELDTTFYAVPRPQIIDAWMRNTPPGFKFAAKFPQTITHEKRLAGALRDVEEFLDAIRRLGDRLGPLLIQLPPDFTFESFADLVGFLPGLPKDLEIAVELRHRSWLRRETYKVLAENGVAFCMNDIPYLPRTIEVTAPFAYVRWIGQRGGMERFDRVQIDRRVDITEWAEVIRDLAGKGTRVYGYVSNQYSGFAPATTTHLKRQLGLPVVDPEQIGAHQRPLL